MMALKNMNEREQIHECPLQATKYGIVHVNTLFLMHLVRICNS